MELAPLWEGFQYKEHQVDGVRWMVDRESAEFPGGLLCDEMGLGKTMEILGLIRNTSIQETLLLGPKAVLGQWKDAAIKSKLNVACFDNGWKPPQPFFKGKPFLYIANYEKLSRKSHFKKKWGRIVLDEAHKVRNRNSAMYRSISELSYASLWAVTATPVVNNLNDIRNLLALVGYSLVKLVNYAYILECMQEACLHRSMEDMRNVLTDLPAAPTIKTISLDFASEDEKEFYQGIQGKLMKRFKALQQDEYTGSFELIMKLRQLSIHPQIYINARRKAWPGYIRPDMPEESTKFLALKNMINNSPPARFIVFCQFHDEMDMLEEYLSKDSSISRIQQYSGAISDKEREDVLEATKTSVKGHDILLLQLQSGGVGLNLQHFNKIIFMSPWWTAALMDQAIGRAVRIGQKEVVEVTRIVLKEEDSLNIDQQMLQTADSKRNTLEQLFKHSTNGKDTSKVATATATASEDPVNEDPLA